MQEKKSFPQDEKFLSNGGSRIAEFRKKAGLTQTQLAAFTGVNLSTIQKWEKGKSGVDQIRKFLKLCTILDCHLQDLIEEDPNAIGFSLKELRKIRKKWKVSNTSDTNDM